MSFLKKIIDKPVYSLIIAALVGGVSYFVYRKIKKAVTVYRPVVKVNPVGLPASWSADPLAVRLRENMKGSEFFSWNKNKLKDRVDSWNELSSLATDDMVKAVYNRFNDLTKSDNSGTLTQWISDENIYSIVLFAGLTSDVQNRAKDKALTRLTMIGLP